MGFITENGIFVPAVTAAQMKEIDRTAIEESGPNLYQMMENAGRNLAQLTISVLGKNRDQEILILAGTGGNGGGGICAARHLSNRGYRVKVCVTEPDALSVVTQNQLHILTSTNVKIISGMKLKTEKPDLIIDAVLGYGLESKPRGKALEFIEWVDTQLCIKISLDIPSGLNATNGEAYSSFVSPDLTLTLALPKTGLKKMHTGELFLGDIGLTKGCVKRIVPALDEKLFSEEYILRLYNHREVQNARHCQNLDSNQYVI